MTIFKYLFLSSLFFALPAQADEIDLALVFRCDPIFCPDASGAQSPVARELRNHIGINPGNPSINMPNIPRVRIATRVPSGASPQNGGGSPAPASPYSAGTESSPDGSDAANGETQTASTPGNGGMSGFQPNAQQASVDPAGMNVGNHKGVTTVGGMMYSDVEDPKLEKIEAPASASNGQLAESFNPQNAVAANKGLDTGGGGKSGGGSSPRGVASGGGSGGKFGEVDNSPTTLQSPGGTGITGHLAALAAALGNGAQSVASALGFGGGGSRYADGSPKVDKNGNPIGPDGKPLNMAKTVSIDRNLLKDRYGRYLSSSKKLEFGAADDMMFQGMCGHYAAYAANNNIPYDRKGCQ